MPKTAVARKDSNLRLYYTKNTLQASTQYCWRKVCSEPNTHVHQVFTDSQHLYCCWPRDQTRNQCTVGGLPTSHWTPGLRQVSSLQRRWRNDRAPDATVSSSRL